MMNADAAVTSNAVVGTRQRTVLFVDDEERVLKSMRAMFRRDYNVLLANSGQEALDLLAGNEVDVIVSDQRMPGMTGVEVLKEVKARAPQAMRILLTGYADLEAVEASINEGEVFRYLTKPCPTDQLKEAVGLAADIACKGEASAAPVDSSFPIAQPVAEQAAEQATEQAQSSAPVASNAVEAVEAIPTKIDEPVVEALPPEEPELIPMLTLEGEPGADAEVPAPAPPIQKTTPRVPGQVDLLVFSQDADMTDAFKDAVDDRHAVHASTSMEGAIEMLEKYPVGVLITDRAVDEDAVAKLTAALKVHVPELVTIVASGRSDAQMLIDLINYGQIFRFLLKPLRGGQCRLSVDAAVTKHLDLMADPDLSRRHAVESREAEDEESVMGVVFARLRRVRDRFFTAETPA